MIKYKLTNQKSQTYGQTQWGENITHTASGRGSLCGKGWIHVYESPKLAVLLNSIHANFDDPLLWECQATGRSKHDHGLKSGYTSVTTLRQIPLPVITAEQRVKFAILCALEVYEDNNFRTWANRWLEGTDRTTTAAWVAANAARAAANTARAAEWAAAWAARAAANAADAADAAWAAAWAAARAARIKGKLTPLKLLQIADSAVS